MEASKEVLVMLRLLEVGCPTAMLHDAARTETAGDMAAT